MAEMTEAKIYEALGLEVPAAENVQEAGEPEVHTDPGAAEAGQTAAETVEQIPPQEGSEEAMQDGGAGDVPAGKPAQTQQERRENAARRRKAEQQAAIDAALAAQKQQFDAQLQTFFQKAGMKNSVTGEPITNMEQFDAWQSQHSNQRLERALKSGNMSRDVLDQLISEHPAVKQAAALVEQSRVAEQQRQEAEARARADADLAEIRKLDPSIQSIGDLLTMDRAEQFSDCIKRLHCSFLDAYKLTYMDRLTEAAAQAGRSQALLSARSKDHLAGAVPGRGAGEVSISPQERALYRALNPGASDADIQAFHNKFHKK